MANIVNRAIDPNCLLPTPFRIQPAVFSEYRIENLVPTTLVLSPDAEVAGNRFADAYLGHGIRDYGKPDRGGCVGEGRGPQLVTVYFPQPSGHRREGYRAAHQIDGRKARAILGIDPRPAEAADHGVDRIHAALDQGPASLVDPFRLKYYCSLLPETRAKVKHHLARIRLQALFSLSALFQQPGLRPTAQALS